MVVVHVVIAVVLRGSDDGGGDVMIMLDIEIEMVVRKKMRVMMTVEMVIVVTMMEAERVMERQ